MEIFEATALSVVFFAPTNGKLISATTIKNEETTNPVKIINGVCSTVNDDLAYRASLRIVIFFVRVRTEVAPSNLLHFIHP